MILRFSNWFIRVSRWWVALLFAVVFFGYTATEVVSQAERSKEYQGEVGSVDLRFWYSPDDVFEMAEVYGEEGREAYIYARITFDAIFPIVYGLFLLTSISFLATNQFETGSNWIYLNLIPAIGVFFDYLENGFAVIVMRAYPERNFLFASLLPFMTMLKWVFVSGSFVILFFLLFRWVYLKIKKKT